MDFKKIYSELLALDIGDVLQEEPMYKYTTFRVGGPARVFVKVKDINAIQVALAYCKKHDLPYFILGNGSNLLFSDKEFEGVVIAMQPYLSSYSINGSFIEANAGMQMIKLSYEAAKCGLSGFEFMSGIPGTIGGGIFMNAGAYKYDMASIVKSVTYIDGAGNLNTLNNEQLEFAYRTSIFQKNRDWTIVHATFEMETKDAKEIQAVLDQRKERRMATQPWNFPSAGSVFRNPDEKGAWYYIDQAGLRGYQIGGAKVSPKHSNFIVNDGYASAKDIYDLIEYVKATVYDKFKITLKQEICYINWN